MIDPWSEQYAPGPRTITQTFNPGIGEYGVDIALPVGTPVRSPYPSVVVGAEDKGKSDWGKRIFAEFISGPLAGYTFGVGHLTAFGAQPGQQLPAGGLLGYSGGAVTDPSSGHSTGPHIEPQLIAPGGQYLDPLNWLRSVFASGGSGGPATTKLPGGVPLNLPSDYRAVISGPGLGPQFNPNLQQVPGDVASALGQIPSAVGQAVGAAIFAPFAALWNGVLGFIDALNKNTQVFFQRNFIAVGVALAVCLVLFVL